MKYLVGLSADSGGLEALALGSVLARSNGGSLIVCSIVPAKWAPNAGGQVDAEYAAFVRKYAQKAQDKAKATLALDIEADFITRSADSGHAGLLDTARELDVDMLVLGSSRSAPRGRFAEGAVAASLLHSAELPVAAAPKGYAPSAGSRLKRLTCAVAGLADDAQHLPERVADYCRNFHIPLRLATFVVRDKQLYPSGAGYSAEDMIANQFIRQAKEMQEEIVAGWNHGDVPLSRQIGDGKTWRAALDSLSWLDQEMIVVGSSSLGVVMRVFLGSNSGKIAHNSPVPCLILPRR